MICEAQLLNAVLEELDVVATTELRIAAVMFARPLAAANANTGNILIEGHTATALARLN